MYNEQKILFKDTEDFGTLCICALRYCHGRQSYMPSYVIEIITEHLKENSDKDIKVMLDDCDFQERMDLYGSDIDKQDWLKWKRTLEEEIKRRKENKASSLKEFANKSVPTKEELLLMNRMLP